MPGPSDPNDPTNPNYTGPKKLRLWGEQAAGWKPSSVNQREIERDGKLLKTFEALESDNPEKLAQIRTEMVAKGNSQEDIAKHFRDAERNGPDLRRARDSQALAPDAQQTNDAQIGVAQAAQDIAGGQSAKPEHPQSQRVQETAKTANQGPQQSADVPKLEGAEHAANEQRLRSAAGERAAVDERKSTTEADQRKKDEAENSVMKPGKEMSDAQRAKLHSLQARMFRQTGNSITRRTEPGKENPGPDMEQ